MDLNDEINMMMGHTNLKPCPGGCNRIVKMDGDNNWKYVSCACGWSGPADLGESGAIAGWNTRPLEDAQAAEIARLREALMPIPVDTRKPQQAKYPTDCSIDVLVLDKSGVWFKGYYDFSNEKWYDASYGHDRIYATHWMSLPELPKEA